MYMANLILSNEKRNAEKNQIVGRSLSRINMREKITLTTSTITNHLAHLKIMNNQLELFPTLYTQLTFAFYETSDA